MNKIFLFLLLLFSQTCFSQKLKIEDHLFWKDYYCGDSLITKSRLCEILKTDSLSATENRKSETYSYIALGANVISIISSVYTYEKIKNPNKDFFETFKNGMIVTWSGIFIGVVFEILSYNSFENSIRIYNENH